jgi:peptidoglycan/LPS O-acetylase OafA/YrhL
MIEQQSRASVVALDLLRGLAATVVLLAHVRGSSFVEFGSLPADQKTNIVRLLFGFTRLGEEAVLVFFVLSGFLVGGQIITRARMGTFDVKIYAIDRCTRILLPLVPACLLTVIISLLVFNEGTGMFRPVANMVGMNGVLAPTLKHNAPLWSISFEIWFYIVGGAMGYLATRNASLGAILIIAVCSIVFSILGPTYLLYWAFGALMVLCLNIRFKSTFFFVGVSFALIGAVFHELSFPSKSFTNVSYIPIEASRALICIGVSFCLPFLCSGSADRFLGFLRQPARALSAVSYSMYVVHYPINYALETVFPRFNTISLEALAYFVARILICVAVTMIFYLCFERNTPALRRYLLKRVSPGRPSVASHMSEAIV